MGKDINQELKEQNVMLERLDNDMGDAGNHDPDLQKQLIYTSPPSNLTSSSQSN